MKTAHTPGSWYESSTGNHQGLIIAEDTGENIAVSYKKENSALIAAAPELLAALEYWFDSKATPEELATRARAAIAKARGEA